MNELIILGAGPHACEMADLVAQINAVGPVWQLRGFLVPESESALVGTRLVPDHVVLGTYADIGNWPAAQLAWAFDCAFPDFPAQRVATLIAPSATIAATATVGKGCVIYPNCFVGHKARVGDRVFVLAGSVINHDVVIEDDVTLATHVALAGSVHVETGCYLGQSCTVRQELRIGAGATVGMGAVVVGDVAAGVVVAGNPARPLADRIRGRTPESGD